MMSMAWGDGDGGVDGVAVAVVEVATKTRGGEWVWGSGRSGYGDPFWCWPEKPAGKVFRRRRGGGGRRGRGLPDNEKERDGVIYQLLNDIVQLKQVDCTIEVYYHKMKENGERNQRKRLIQFLMGLDDSYANVMGQILLMQPLPSVVKAYSMIRQKEKQSEGLITKPPTNAIFSTFSNNQRYNQNNFRGNRSTYSQGESFKRRNYNQGETSKRRSSFRKGVICGNCGKE
ncbi:hypothetical protein Tco_0979533 [Tanacetum coccineum]